MVNLFQLGIVQSHLFFVIGFTRGIKHDVPFIKIRKVPKEVLKSEGENMKMKKILAHYIL